ncbi:MAG: hypothetical protein EOL87_18050 [Spartobacteria bacterium]|nr:hypothetical protein [Spartobacteria bacterium]
MAWFGGSCVQGRYLLIVIPLLAPGSAWCLARVREKETGLFFVLSAVSILPAVYILHWVPYIGRAFISPLQMIDMQPLFNGTFSPYINLPAIHLSSWMRYTGQLFPIIVFGGTLLLLFCKRLGGWMLLIAALIMAIGVHAGKSHAVPQDTLDYMRETLFDRVDPSNVRLSRGPHQTQCVFCLFSELRTDGQKSVGKIVIFLSKKEHLHCA